MTEFTAPTLEDERDLREAHWGQVFAGDERRVHVDLNLPVLQSLRVAGLTRHEEDLCRQWAGRSPRQVARQELHLSLRVIQQVPIPVAGSLSKEVFWHQVLFESGTFWQDCFRFIDEIREPTMLLSQIADKIARFWIQFADENQPEYVDLVGWLRGEEDRVRLSKVWRTALWLQFVRTGQVEGLDPEVVYGALPDAEQLVEVDCWRQHDETRLRLEASEGREVCTSCELVSADSMGWAWGSGSRTCPRCLYVALQRSPEGDPSDEQGNRRSVGPRYSAQLGMPV